MPFGKTESSEIRISSRCPAPSRRLGPFDALSKTFTASGSQRRVSRAELQTGLEPVIQDLQAALEQGRDCGDAKAATFCSNVLALYPALWLFAMVEGVEPTNNHIERLLRPGVLWRKNAFGNHNKQPRPEAEVLGRPPRGGRLRGVAPFGGGDVGKAPPGPQRLLEVELALSTLPLLLLTDVLPHAA